MLKTGLDKLTKQSMEDAPEDAKWVQSVKNTVNGTVDVLENIKSKGNGIKLLDDADVEQVEVDVQVPDPWIRVTAWENGAADSGVPFDKSYYMKHPDGSVEYRFWPT